MTIVTVYATFASPDEAQRIARAVVTERLAACANILGPCHSIYRWHGAIEEAPETPAIFKTSRDQADSLIARITALHSFDNPCITVWPIDKLPIDYAEWVEGSVG
ncbi:MAG: divalent-cation tolerance protein CutA [Sphingomicrobium sp.]